MKRLPFVTLTLAAVAMALGLAPALADTFALDRSAFTNGEVWRLLTGHLTHFDNDHLVWDVVALLVLGGLAELDSRRAVVWTLAIAAAAIGVSVVVLQPQFDSYRGLSGLDSALFGLVIARLGLDGWRQRHGFSMALAGLAGGGFLAKTGWEFAVGDTLFAVGATYAPVPLAHLVGLLAGIGVACGFVSSSADPVRPATAGSAALAPNSPHDWDGIDPPPTSLPAAAHPASASHPTSQ